MLVKIFVHLLCIAFGFAIIAGVSPFPSWDMFVGLQKSPDSLPYDIVFKTSKLALAILILTLAPRFLGLKIEFFRNKKKYISIVTISVLFSCAALIFPAVAVGYVRFDAGWPPGALLWMVNNLIFVCFGEEVFFRGYIQNELHRRIKAPHSDLLAIVLAAIIFGLAHYRGGVTYMVLSSLAGLAYGWAFHKGGLLTSVSTHFFVNAIHLFMFSYPALRTG